MLAAFANTVGEVGFEAGDVAVSPELLPIGQASSKRLFPVYRVYGPFLFDRIVFTA